MKGVVMNKMEYYNPFVCAPRGDGKIGAYGVTAIIAFIIMLVAVAMPETKEIGFGIGLDYNLVP
jgi:hypothetical protein|tara:strand:- start:1929 stop:2120 length:192 start_codon:yes stop_codon:yes gene_type:complete